MKILVTGGTGFLGKYVVDELIQLGHQVVVAVKHFSENINLNDNNKSIKYKITDLSNHNEVNFIIKDIEVVYHVAGRVPNSLVEAKSFYKDNALTTFNILSACKNNRISRLLVVSSSEVYGNIRKEQIREEEKLNPSSLYALSKAAAEDYCRLFAESKSTPVQSTTVITVVRPGYIYGFGQLPQRLFPRLIRSSFLKNVDENVDGLVPDSNGHDYVYVKDVAQGIVLLGLVNQKLPIAFFNLGSGKYTTNQEVFSAITALTGTKFSSSVNPGDKLAPAYSLCIDKAKQQGYKLQYDLFSGLQEMLNYNERHK